MNMAIYECIKVQNRFVILFKIQDLYIRSFIFQLFFFRYIEDPAINKKSKECLCYENFSNFLEDENSENEELKELF